LLQGYKALVSKKISAIAYANCSFILSFFFFLFLDKVQQVALKMDYRHSLSFKACDIG